MIAYQDQMDPQRGLLYELLPQARRAEEDCGSSPMPASMAMGVLATAVRSPRTRADEASVPELGQGVCQGRHGRPHWPERRNHREALGRFRDKWWCSTATFSALALLLYEETGDENTERPAWARCSG